MSACKIAGTNRLCKPCHCCCDDGLWPAHPSLTFLTAGGITCHGADHLDAALAKRCQVGLCRCM